LLGVSDIMIFVGGFMIGISYYVREKERQRKKAE